MQLWELPKLAFGPLVWSIRGTTASWGYFGLLVNRYFASLWAQICSMMGILVIYFVVLSAAFNLSIERLSFSTSPLSLVQSRDVWSDTHPPETALDGWFLKWVLFFGTQAFSQVQNLPYCLPDVALQASECWDKTILSSKSLVKVGCKEIGLFFLLFYQDLDLLCIWERKRRLYLAFL